MTQQPPAFSYRFRNPTREDLPRLARLAHEAGATYCGDCRNYHLTTPWLRLLGLSGIGPDMAWESQLDLLVRAVAGKDTVRWLVAGSADAGVPALVGGVAAMLPGTSHRLTVVDRCETPLVLCRAHAEAEGWDIEAVLGDLRSFHRDRAFDAVLMHFTTLFFDDDELIPFLRHAASWLAPDGVIVSGFHYDRPSSQPPQSPGPAVWAWRSAVIREDAPAGRMALPEETEAFIARIKPRAPKLATRRAALADAAEIMRAAGLVPRDVALLPFADAEAALWGDDCRQRCFVTATRGA